MAIYRSIQILGLRELEIRNHASCFPCHKIALMLAEENEILPEQAILHFSGMGVPNSYYTPKFSPHRPTKKNAFKGVLASIEEMI